jgi:hypothetical protein
MFARTRAFHGSAGAFAHRHVAGCSRARPNSASNAVACRGVVTHRAKVQVMTSGPGYSSAPQTATSTAPHGGPDKVGLLGHRLPASHPHLPFPFSRIWVGYGVRPGDALVVVGAVVLARKGGGRRLRPLQVRVARRSSLVRDT